MDILRSHHLTPTQILSDATTQTWVRWYPSAAGASAYPGWHAFGDPVWESDFPTPAGVGCYPSPLIWRGKRYPAAPGNHFLGNPDWFANGMPSADLSTPPIAATCQGLVQSAQGGTTIGGSSWPVSPTPSPKALLGSASRSPRQLPQYQFVSVQHNSTPSTSTSISGYQLSAACACVSVSAEVIYMITSCLTYNAQAALLNDLALPLTQTPLTKYDVTAFAGGTTVTGLAPQVLKYGPQQVTLFNIGVEPLVIQGSAAGSQIPNRILLPPTYGGEVTLEQYDSITLVYDPCNPVPQWATQSCTVDVDESLADILAYVEANYTPTLAVTQAVLAQGAYPLGTSMASLPVFVNLVPGAYLLFAEWGVSFQQGVNQGEIGASGQIWDATAGQAVPNSQTPIFTESAQKGQTGFFNAAVSVAKYTVVTNPTTLYMQAEYTASDPDAVVTALGDASSIASATRMFAVRVG